MSGALVYEIKRLCKAQIFTLLRSPRIDFKEPILPDCVDCRARYDSPIPTRFLAPIECLKIQAQPQPPPPPQGDAGGGERYSEYSILKRFINNV